MDQTIHDRVAGRNEAADGPGHDSPATQDSAESGSAASADIVTVCAWCPNLHILKLQLRDVGVLIVYKQGKELRIMRNGQNLIVSHGICAPCRERMK